MTDSTAPRYYTVEGDTYVAQAKWEETNATTLAQAKRIARRRQRFYGTTLRVAERTGSMSFIVRSIAAADPIEVLEQIRQGKPQKSEWQDT